MFGLIFSMVTTVLVARLARGGSAASPKEAGGSVRLGAFEVLVGRVVDGGYRPGPGTDPLPTIILLHGEGDDPSAAWQVLPTSRPVRVLVPVGPLADFTGRRYTDPLLQGESRRAALSRLADDLALTIIAATQRYAVEDRLVAVGAGALGAVALVEALRGPAWFRAAFAAGGTMTAEWIPGPAPTDAPLLFKLSYGDAIGLDQLAAAKAKGLGWQLQLDEGDVDVVGLAPDAATVRAWLSLRWSEIIG